MGSHLVEALLKRGDEVTCLVRPASNKRWLVNLPVKYAAGDPADKSFLKEAVRGQDYIYHIAGLIRAYSYEAYQKTNVQLTADLVESAAEAGGSGLKRFVHLSSLAATGPAPDIAGVDEETDCRPITDYGRTKLLGETALRPYLGRVPITIIRPPPVYGPRDDGLLIYFKAVSWGLVPYFSPRRHISIIYVHDLVNAMLKAAQHPATAGNTYFVANETPFAINELAGLIKSGVRNNKISCHLWLPDVLIKGLAALSEGLSHLSGRPTIFNRQKALELTRDYWVCRVARANRDFQWTARTALPDGVRETVRWYREYNWI